MSDLKLYEGINHIDDDLIDEANVPARRPKYYTFALSAAAILLIIGVSGISFGANSKFKPSRYLGTEISTTAESAATTTLSSVQNTVTTYADTVTTRKVRETTYTTSVNKEDKISSTETSAKDNTGVTAVQGTVRTASGTYAAVQTAVSVPVVTTAVTDPQSTSAQPVTTDANFNEGSYDMKKVLSLMSAAVMMNPITAKIAYSADASYKDPAERYGLGSERYIEETAEIGTAEQELFSRIEQGTIDIDIDRNGELDMRDAALLYTYEWLEYLYENQNDIDSDDAFYRERFESFDISTISDKALDFLETREDIRNKELFSRSRYYTPWQVAHLDSDLIIRYHLTHTLKPDYFKEAYYSDVAGYDIAYNKFNGSVGYNRTQLLNTIRESYFTDLDYDLNGDGAFDLHDVQDYEEYQFGYKVYSTDYDKILSADHIDISEYREYPDSADSISETVFRNCVKLEKVNEEYEDLYSWDFQKNTGSGGIVKIGFQKLIELFFMRNDFKLIYTTPEYYRDNRPGCEGLPLYDRIDFYSFVKQYAGRQGYTTEKISFNENTFNLFYEKWSTAVKNETADIPDINGNGVIDTDDYSYLEMYEKEIWDKTSSEESKLPKSIRNYLDKDFDLNDNGISGDLYDVMGAMAFIRINYPECKNYTVNTEETLTESFELRKGDVNCDGNVSVADAVAILQFIGNSDRYPLKEQGRVNADVNGDGSVTALDALEIQRIDAGISAEE
ncbi:MAG: dockerin type I repeat-containing protein [Ruminococcus sp.]|nr:dockerin type I repeat-containing protein [Ruminococcus sp.]